MKARVSLVAVFVVLALVLSAPMASAKGLAYSEVAGEFICNCGCNQLLKDCDTMPCAYKDTLKGVIGRMIAANMTKDEIVKYLVLNYGKQLRAAPEKSGFDLTAWLMPYVLAIFGAAGLYFLLSTWVQARRETAPVEPEGESPKPARPVDKKYSDKLEKELKDFGWY